MRAAPAVNIFFMENEEPLHYVQELSNCRSLEALQAKLQSTDSRWLEEFIEVGGLDAIVNCLTALCCRDEVDYEDGESLPQLQCIGCLKAAMNHQYGMECLIKRPGPGDASLLSQMALGELGENELDFMASVGCTEGQGARGGRGGGGGGGRNEHSEGRRVGKKGKWTKEVFVEKNKFPLYALVRPN